MARETHDVIIVGGGSGGLTAAVGCAQLGMKTALIDKERLGGDCLHYGCVPSKSLIKTATVYQQARTGSRYGLHDMNPGPVDMGKVNARIAGVIAEIEKHDSPERFEKLGAEVFLGKAEFASPHEIRFNGEKTISAPKIILATGSSPRAIPFKGLQEAGYITNLDAFSLPNLPARIVTIGAGPIGVELSQAYTRLGAKVTIVDLAGHVLPREDADMAEVVQKQITAEGIQLRLGATVDHVEKDGAVKKVVIKKKDGSEEVLEADEILLAVGRQGNTSELNLEAAGVAVEKSFVTVDSKLRSSQKHIMAVGDVNGRFLFTHVAGAEGSLAVRRIALHAGGSMNYQNVPWCTYTEPELASIGYNETRAKDAGLNYHTVIQPFGSTDRAQAEGDTEGMMKLLLDRKDRVLGVQIVGLHAGELIAPSLFAVSEGWKARQLMRPMFPYPTLSELTRKTMSSYMAPRLFNDRIRGMLRFLFRYRGDGGEGYK